jgi:tRNA (mo5U34)-methyltransferase
MDRAVILEKINSVKHWYHRIEIMPGVITPGVNDSARALELLNLPQDCTGKRVLDLGTRDGFFAFELEKRGAEVLAMDYQPMERTGFGVMAEILGSKVTFVQDNIYNISSEKYGKFDIVLFLGLIYHLRDPLGALDIIRDICQGELYLETQVIDNAFLNADGKLVPLKSISEELLHLPIMQFYPGTALNNDATNFWAPNFKCMEMLLLESNFEVLDKKLYGQRANFKCRVATNPNLEMHRQVARGRVLPGKTDTK